MEIFLDIIEDLEALDNLDNLDILDYLKRNKIILLIFSFIAISINCFGQLNTDRLTAIGRNALYFDDYVLSIQYFNQVIKIKPYLSEPYLLRAIAKIQLGDYNGAERDCNTAIENNPFLPGAYYTRGFIYRQTRQLDKAEEDFSQALRFSPENRTYTLLRADVRAQKEEYELALEDIDYLLHREPHSAMLHYERAAVCISKKDTLCALRHFSEAVQYDSQNPANWSARGLTNMMLGNEQDALLDLNKAIELGSKWAGDYINRGIINYKQHNYRGAIADYDMAVEIDPKNGQCYYNRALLRTEVGDYNRALSDLDKAIELMPDNAEIYYQRGVVNLQLRKWTDAVNDFDKLIARYPYFLPSYYLAAQAKTALDDPKAAWQYQQKAHELELKKDEIQKARNEINTDVKLADSQPQKRDRRKEFSNHAAQNQSEELAENDYQSETRGSVQKRYTDVINEPNFALSYYSIDQPLRRTNYFHYTIDDYNKQHLLPSPLKITLQEVALTADMVNQHFAAIERLNSLIGATEGSTDSIKIGNLHFRRAIEFALVQDYASAIDDCTKASLLIPDMPLTYFCRANWRYKQLEYQRSTGEINASNSTKATLDFELILRDLDKVIRMQPDFAFAYYNKANILCTQKDFKAAIEYYTKAIEQDNELAEAYFNRGLTRLYIDDDSGLQDLSKAGELGIYQAYNLITRFQ